MNVRHRMVLSSILGGTLLVLASAPPHAGHGAQLRYGDPAPSAVKKYLTDLSGVHRQTAQKISLGAYKSADDMKTDFSAARKQADASLAISVMNALTPFMDSNGKFTDSAKAAAVYNQIADAFVASPEPVPPGPPPGPPPNPPPGPNGLSERMSKVATNMESSASEMRAIAKDLEKLQQVSDMLQGLTSRKREER
jgi:hypothetical protein